MPTNQARCGDAASQIFTEAWPANDTADVLSWPGDEQILLAHGSALWRILFDGSPPERLAEGIAGFARGERFVAFTRPVSLSAGADPRYTVTIEELGSRQQRTVGETDRATIAAAAGAAYFLRGGALWRAPFGGGPAEQTGRLSGAEARRGEGGPLEIAPDGGRVAYRCGSDLCLADVDGKRTARIELGFEPASPPADERPGIPPGPQPTALPAGFARPYLAAMRVAWSADGQQLAVASAATDERGRPELRIVARAGQVLQRMQIGPDGTLGAPQWSPDGRFVLLNAYPAGGRRIVAVDLASGRALDLSQPRWDAFASLMPGGRALLLWNGRGGFWRAQLHYTVTSRPSAAER